MCKTSQAEAVNRANRIQRKVFGSFLRGGVRHLAEPLVDARFQFGGCFVGKGDAQNF